MAHSMGNVVTGETLRRLGSFTIPGTDQRYVRIYLALQAAIPAHCYDGSEKLTISTASSSARRLRCSGVFGIQL